MTAAPAENNPMTIDKDQTYQTRDGCEVRIYAVGGGGVHPVHGAVKDKNGQWFQSSWASNGSYLAGGEICNNDLVLVPKRHKRHTREVWINMYPDRTGVLYADKSTAITTRARGCIAFIHHTFEFVEGEGL